MPGLLLACGLVVPYLFYYDATTFLLPLLVLWSFRAGMGRGQLGLLIGLTVGYYGALPAHQYLPNGWSGPPWATLANVGLWALSLWVALGWPAGEEVTPATAGAE
jgi:hypothetical protein